MCKLGAEQNFAALLESSVWRSYVTLTAGTVSLPSEDSRRALHDQLIASEANFVYRMAEFYAAAAPMIGYRLRPEFSGDYRVLAVLGAAVVEGLALRRTLSPQLVGLRLDETAFTAGTGERDWGLAALGFTSILMSMVEPDLSFVPPDRAAL